eukprot:SAG22_NODE_790_length_7216_cov_5.198820_5_plen_91_part_00
MFLCLSLRFHCAHNGPLQSEAEGVRIFTADIIYHLFDQFTAYLEELHEEAKREAQERIVFPATFKILGADMVRRQAATGSRLSTTAMLSL